MLESMLLPIALLSMPISAPFILTSEDAAEVDRRLDLSSCDISKGGATRYYFYDFMAINSKFEVDPLMVRFVIIADGKDQVHAVADLLIEGETADKMQAFGIYNIDEDKVQRITCVPQ